MAGDGSEELRNVAEAAGTSSECCVRGSRSAKATDARFYS